MFLQWLHEEAIQTSFEAATPEAALAELVAMLPSWGMQARQKGAFLTDLLEHRSGNVIEINGEILVCYAMSRDVAFPLASFGISRNGIAFMSGVSARLYSCVFLVVLPESDDSSLQQRQLETDATVFFNDTFLKHRLKIAESAGEAYEVLLRHAQQRDLLAHEPAAERYKIVS